MARRQNAQQTHRCADARGCHACSVARMTTIRNRIVVLASRDEGVNCMDMQTRLGIPINSMHSHMQALEHQCRIVRGDIPGQRLQWFTSPVCRDAWVAERVVGAATAAIAVEAQRKLGKKAHEKTRADKDKAARAAGMWVARPRSSPHPGAVYTAGASKFALPRGEPIITSNTKVTIALTPEVYARWQSQPNQPPPGFAGMGIGRYL